MKTVNIVRLHMRNNMDIILDNITIINQHVPKTEPARTENRAAVFV